MTKPYLKSPIVAAWMAENFDVDYITDCGVKCFIRCLEQDHYVLVEKEPREGELPKSFSRFHKEYYIHPDSLHIFEPQGGDLVQDEHNREVFTVSSENKRFNARGTFGACEDNHHILKRCNIPFFDYRNPELGGCDD